MSGNSKLIIFTDGGARGNPGPAALGVVIYDIAGKLLKKYGKYLGERTNNEAEYEAVIAASRTAAELGAVVLDFHLDSELVVRQFNNIYRVKNRRMQELLIRARSAQSQFQKVTFRHIPREKNRLADQLVNDAIDRAQR